MKNALQKIDSIIEKIQNFILIITGTGVTLMILVNALFRFLAVDWFGSEELTLFVAFWLYFTGSACAAREDTHISADMLSLFIKRKDFLRIFKIAKNVIGMVMSAVFAAWACQFVMWQYGLGSVSAVYKLPVVITQIPIFLTFALWTIYLLRDLLRCFAQNDENSSKGVEMP